MKTNIIGNRSLKYPLWMVGIGLLAVIGLATIVYGFVAGHEETFNTSTGVPWGILISTYLFFVLPASGLCLLSSLGHVFGMERFEPFGKRAVLLALVMLMSGFLVIASDLERPWRMAIYVLITPNPTSAIWWMGTLYGIYFMVLSVEFVLLNRTAALQKLLATPEEMNIVERLLTVGGRKNPAGAMLQSKNISRVFGITALCLAISALSTLGGVFGLLGSRALWHGPMLPVYFVLSALVGGTAVLILATTVTEWARGRAMTAEMKEAIAGMGKMLLVVLGIFMLFTVWMLLTSQYGRIPDDYASVMVLLNGKLSVSFWVLEVVVGILAPVALLFYAKSQNMRVLALAAAMVIVGMFAARYDFVVAGQLVPVIGKAGLWNYVPSPTEIMTVVAAFAMMMFLYSLGDRVLPLVEPEAIGETVSPEPAVDTSPAALIHQPVRN